MLSKVIKSPLKKSKKKYIKKYPTAGQPPKFTDEQVFQQKVDEYFDFCDNRTRKVYDDTKHAELLIAWPEPYTVGGLCYWLDMDRLTLLNYSKQEKFFNTIKRAKLRIAMDVERRLMDGRATAGAIFNLKNNFGWKDKSETEHSGNISWKEELPK